MACTTVRMPFSGSTRPTTPTMGSSGRPLRRALQDASGGPGWNRSGSTACGTTRRRCRSADRVGHRPADRHAHRRQPHRRPQHDATESGAHEIVELQHHGAAGDPPGHGAVQMGPQAVGMDHVRTPRQPSQGPCAAPGAGDLLAESPRAGPSAPRRPQPEVGRGGEFDMGTAQARPRLGQVAGRRRQRQRDAPLLEQRRQAEQAPLGSPQLRRDRDDEDVQAVGGGVRVRPCRLAIHRSTVDHMVGRSPRASGPCRPRRLPGGT